MEPQIGMDFTDFADLYFKPRAAWIVADLWILADFMHRLAVLVANLLGKPLCKPNGQTHHERLCQNLQNLPPIMAKPPNGKFYESAKSAKSIPICGLKSHINR